MPNETKPNSSLDRELKRGVLDLVLLALLKDRPRYGYEIVTTIADRTRGLLEVKDGTLYPILYRLETAGFVEAYWESPDPTGGRGMPRKYYRVTNAGHVHYGMLVEQWQTFVHAIAQIVDMPTLRDQP